MRKDVPDRERRRRRREREREDGRGGMERKWWRIFTVPLWWHGGKHPAGWDQPTCLLAFHVTELAEGSLDSY